MILRVLISVLFLIISFNFAFAEGETQTAPQQQVQTPPQNPATVAQNIPFENCTKMFGSINKENLFYLTLGAISANRFTIEEIQTQNGYVIFTAARQKYLATVAGIDNNNSILKITPCNDIYFFQPGILTNIFKYIDLNSNVGIN